MYNLSNVINVLHNPTLFIGCVIAVLLLGLIIFLINFKSRACLIYYAIAFLLSAALFFAIRFAGLEIAKSLVNEYASIINTVGSQFLNVFLVYGVVTLVLGVASIVLFVVLKKKNK